ncbi:MAG: hypothetical protein K6L76_13525 [Agarilytica sp.]
MKYTLIFTIVLLASCDSTKGFISGFQGGSSSDVGIVCSRQNQILSVKLVDETDQSAYIEVEYFYDNAFGPNASIHIEPVVDVYWPHQSIKPMMGHHKVIVKLSHPGMGNSPEVISVKKAEVMLRVKEYDNKRDSYRSSKLTSSFFKLEKVFNKPSRG